MSLSSAASRDRSTASRVAWARSTGCGSLSEAATCSRDRSTISCTSRVSRGDSTCIRCGEPGHGLRVVVRVEHGLGQQGQRRRPGS